MCFVIHYLSNKIIPSADAKITEFITPFHKSLRSKWALSHPFFTVKNKYH